MSMSVALKLKEHKMKKNKLFGLFVLLVVLVIISSFSFIYYKFFLNNFNEEKALRDTLTSTITVIDKYLDYNLETLSIIAGMVSDNPDLASLENVSTLLGNIKRPNLFQNVSYGASNSTGYTYNYYSKTLSPADFNSESCFWISNGGNNCFRYKFENNTVMLSVPVISKSGSNLGFVSAESPDFRLFSYILNKKSKTNDKYDMYLVTSDGFIITKNGTYGNYGDERSFFALGYPVLKSSSDAIFNFSSNNNINSKWFLNSALKPSFIAVGKLKYSDYRIILVYSNIPAEDNIKNSKTESQITNDVSLTGNSIKINFSYEKALKICLIIICSIILLAIFIYSCVRLYNLISKKYYKTVMKYALYDEVTDGFSKPKFYLEVSNILLKANDDDKFALMYMDIHNFNLINQVYDFIKGNDILKDVSESIRWFLEKDGISARIMSDNFAILYNYKQEEKIINFINNLTRAIGEYKISIKLIPHFGIFKINDFSMPVEVMIDNAIMANKTITGDYLNYAFFTKELVDKVNQSKELENEMYFALNQEQFVLYLQPQIDLKTGNVVGAEALVRWKHPQKGLLLPDKFLNIFEKKSFITYLDQYVIETVCKLISKWIAANIELIPVSVNLSCLNLTNPRFAEMMKSMVEMYKIPPQFINFEFDEASIFENRKYVNKSLSDLKNYGFSLSLDNFGKIYSSVNLFNMFDFDRVKFNMDFIKNSILNERGKNLLREMNLLVKMANTKSVAMGIETDSQKDVVRISKFDLMQGFLHSRPMSIPDFEIFVFKKNIVNTLNEDIENG